MDKLMKQGFLENYTLKHVKNQRNTSIGILFVGAIFLIFAIFIYSFMAKKPESSSYALMSAAMFSMPGIALLLVAIISFAKSKKELGNALEYRNLTILSNHIDKKSSVQIINDEIEQGKVLVKIQPFKIAKNVQIILTPTYLLFFHGVITAVTYDKIYWICVQQVDTMVPINNRNIPLRGYVTGIYYGGKVYYINAKNREEAEANASKFTKYIPNPLGGHDDHLENMHRKDFNSFLKVYLEKSSK